MALPKFEKDIAYISKLDNEPNDVGGLSADELKARFDQAGQDLQQYINEDLVPQAESAIEAAALGVGGGGAISGEMLAPKSISGEKLADGAVTAEKVAAGAVATGAIADKAVTEGKIADGAVSTAKLADKSVTRYKLADEAVSSDKIFPGAVTNTKIGANAVTAEKIADGVVTRAKLAQDALYSPREEITSNYTITVADLGKTLVASSSAVQFSLTAENSAALPTGAEIAILRFSNHSAKLRFSGDGLEAWCAPDTIIRDSSTTADAVVEIPDRFGMIALKKIWSNGWLVTGPVEVVT